MTIEKFTPKNLLDKAKVDSYVYFLHLCNGTIIQFQRLSGPFVEGTKTWYDIHTHDLANMVDEENRAVPLRDTISINADHISMITEAES